MDYIGYAQGRAQFWRDLMAHLLAGRTDELRRILVEKEARAKKDLEDLLQAKARRSQEQKSPESVERAKKHVKQAAGRLRMWERLVEFLEGGHVDQLRRAFRENHRRAIQDRNRRLDEYARRLKEKERLEASKRATPPPAGPSPTTPASPP